MSKLQGGMQLTYSWLAGKALVKGTTRSVQWCIGRQWETPKALGSTTKPCAGDLNGRAALD